MTEPFNVPRDLFATDEHAAEHPETYAPRKRPVSSGTVATGERNALANAARKKSILANLARARRSRRAGRRRGRLGGPKQ